MSNGDTEWHRHPPPDRDRAISERFGGSTLLYELTRLLEAGTPLAGEAINRFTGLNDYARGVIGGARALGRVLYPPKPAWEYERRSKPAEPPDTMPEPGPAPKRRYQIRRGRANLRRT